MDHQKTSIESKNKITPKQKYLSRPALEPRISSSLGLSFNGCNMHFSL